MIYFNEAKNQTTTALQVDIQYCKDGGKCIDGMCSDGSKPIHVQVAIVRSDPKDGEQIIRIEKFGKPIFELMGDGRIKEYPGFTVDEAARVFWAAVAEVMWQYDLDVGKVLEPLRNRAPL